MLHTANWSILMISKARASLRRARAGKASRSGDQIERSARLAKRPDADKLRRERRETEVQNNTENTGSELVGQ